VNTRLSVFGQGCRYHCINQLGLHSWRMMPGFRGLRGGKAVEFLLVLGGLVAALIFVAASSARSYFESGRRRGLEEAIREIGRGVSSHCGLKSGEFPPAVEKAIAAISSLPKRQRLTIGSKPTDPRHAQLWIFGDAIGEACWMKGHAAGVRRKAPAEGKIRVDLSLNELLQLSWLAHLGFQHMMPNYSGFEIYRFVSEDDAREGALAIGKVEGAIPEDDRPIDLAVQYKSRQRLISDWWQARPNRLTA
jgi:hypothetical protein